MSTLVAPTQLLPAPRSARREPAANSTLVQGQAPNPTVWRQLQTSLHEAGLSKSDILLFFTLACVLLLFVPVMCLGARVGHEQAWHWGSNLMNLPLALAGFGLLMFTALGCIGALIAARKSRKLWTVVGLAVAAAGSLGFVATIAMDLDVKWVYGIRPAEAFKPNQRYVARNFGVRLPKKSAATTAVPVAPLIAAPAEHVADALEGRKLYLGTCMSCHGARGEGLPGQGKALLDNEFIGSLDDSKLLAFLKVGRQPWDPQNTTKVQMPPRGGNPMLTDDNLRDVVAHLRTLQKGSKAAPSAEAAATSTGEGLRDSTANPDAMAPPAEAENFRILLPRWVVSAPPVPEPKLTDDYMAQVNRSKWQPPPDAVTFVNAYYAGMSAGALYGGSLLLMMIVLLVNALRGKYGPNRCAPLALGLISSVGVIGYWMLAFPLVFLF